jgi:predicted transcriptional regulator
MAENNADAMSRGRHRTPGIVVVPVRVKAALVAIASERGITVAKLLEDTFC